VTTWVDDKPRVPTLAEELRGWRSPRKPRRDRHPRRLTSAKYRAVIGAYEDARRRALHATYGEKGLAADAFLSRMFGPW
jgi:hypothetical protein